MFSAAGAKFFGVKITIVQASPFQKKEKANITIVQALSAPQTRNFFGQNYRPTPIEKKINENHHSTGPTQAQKYQPEITILPFRREREKH